jgi:hypothetical protein
MRSFVPVGTWLLDITSLPSVETLGYFHESPPGTRISLGAAHLVADSHESVQDLSLCRSADNSPAF